MKFDQEFVLLKPVKVLMKLGLHNNIAGLPLEVIDMCNYTSG